MTSSTFRLSMKNAVSKVASASLPAALAGLGVLQCSFFGLPGNSGQLSPAARQYALARRPTHAFGIASHLHQLLGKTHET